MNPTYIQVMYDDECETFQEVDEELAARVKRWLQKGTKDHGWVDRDNIHPGLLPVLKCSLFRSDLGNRVPVLHGEGKVTSPDLLTKKTQTCGG
jgi:hypothetical protein